MDKQHQQTNTEAQESALSSKRSCDPNPSVGANADKSATTTPNPLSKNQMKKRARFEKAQAAKKRKKEQEREARLLKARHDGRDLEKEREQQRQNEQDGKGWERREQLWIQKMKDADVVNSFRVCFDCSFEESMTSKERNSLSLQLRYVYSRNRKSSCPVNIDVCSLKTGNETRLHLEKVAGFPDRWVGRAFNTYEADLKEVYTLNVTANDAAGCSSETISKEGDIDDGKISHTAILHTNAIPQKRLIYLSGDSPNTITTLDNNAIYIIGGIVDRNRLKCAAIDRAKSLNIETARLPLQENLDFKGSTRILTCNHVFEILLGFRENGYEDWKSAILGVLPERKDVEEKKTDNEANTTVDNETNDEVKVTG
eukprot:scaffold83104_cov59-Cyclotella_meneghiniana.AAC.2